MVGREAGIAPNGKSHHYSEMARSGETSSTGDKAAHGKATMRGGARRYFKIPPVIDHRAGSFLADRLRLLGPLLMPLHWPLFLLVTLFLLAAVVTAIIFGITGSGVTQSIFTDAERASTPDITNDPQPEDTPPDSAASQAQLQTQLQAMEEKLNYTQRKLAAALSQLRAANTITPDATSTTILDTATQQGRRAALILVLGTGRPYQELLGHIDRDWLASKDVAALRRYEGQGFYDASHLAGRLSVLLKVDTQTRQELTETLPPALAWLSRHSGGLVAVRPQALTGIADAQHDILKALVVDRPDVALGLVDEIFAEALVSKTDTPSALSDWRDDLAVWCTLAPVMERVHVAYGGQAAPDVELE